MRILSWNVQYGKTANNHLDFVRTLDYINSLGEFDVICLQEISRYMVQYSADGQEDQLQIAEDYFKGYMAIWGTGFSWPSVSSDQSQRQEFGNLTLIKSEILDFKIHQLPLPATPNKQQMQRVAVETIIDSKIGSLSIVNTHLAFHDSGEKQQQLERCCLLEQERLAHHKFPKLLDSGIYQEGYLANARILCGDFNLTPDSEHYRYLVQSDLIDAWQHSHAGQKHKPTCGIFDLEQWPEGSHCRDYFWLSNEFKSHKINVIVDTHTDLSDHQPIILEIDI